MTLSDDRCASAVYSRPGEAYLLLANLGQSLREVTCVLHPERLPYPLAHPVAARVTDPGERDVPSLDVSQLLGKGLTIEIPGDDAILVQIRSR